MAALGLFLLSVLRRDRFADVSDALFYATVLRFRWLGWGSSWLGRLTLVLSLTILWLAFLLLRGGLP